MVEPNSNSDITRPNAEYIVRDDIDLTNLIDYELTFGFRKLSNVLSSMTDVIHDLRCDQSRSRADIELLFNHVKRLQDENSNSGHASKVMAATRAEEQEVDNDLLERIAGIDNRARTIDSKLAQLTSVQEINKGKKMVKDIESMMVRLQVLERVTSTAFANLTIKVSPEEMRARLQEAELVRNMTDAEEVDDGGGNLDDDENQTSDESSKKKSSSSENTRAENDGTGGVDTFLALAKIEKVEALVARMKATQQEFQFRISQENHDRSREMHELKDEITESIKRADEMAGLVEKSELRAAKDLIKQAEIAAIAALKAWQEEQAKEEENNAHRRFDSVQLQVRQLQNVLSGEANKDNDANAKSTLESSSVDKAALESLREFIKRVQGQSAQNAASLSREVSSLNHRMSSLQKAIDDFSVCDQQNDDIVVMEKVTRAGDGRNIDRSVTGPGVVNEILDTMPQPSSNPGPIGDPTITTHVHSTADPQSARKSNSTDGGRDDRPSVSDERTRKVMVQCRLAIQGLKEKLEKQNGDLTRLSSFVYQDIASQLSRLSDNPSSSNHDMHSKSLAPSEAYGHKPFSSVISQTKFPSIVAAEGVDSVKESNLDPSLTDDAELDVWRPRAHRNGISGDNRSDQGEIKKRDKVIDQEIAEIRRDLACKPDVDSIFGLFNVWKDQEVYCNIDNNTEVSNAEEYFQEDNDRRKTNSSQRPIKGNNDFLVTKLTKDVMNKADRGDLSRLESRISILGEEIGQLRSNVAYGLSAGEFSNDTVDSDEAGHESDDDEKRGAAIDMGTGRPNDDQPAIIPTSTASWAAVRVFTKLQDKSSSAALSRRLALNVQDVKRLSKSVGELEEDMDTIRGLTMGIRKKIGELEALQTADDNSDDTLKDKSFIRTLRARLQLMSTELEGKINRNELEGKADITEMNRLASIITAMRRTTSTEAIDQTNVSVGDYTDATTVRSNTSRMSTAMTLAKPLRSSNTRKRQSVVKGSETTKQAASNGSLNRRLQEQLADGALS